jgi:N-acetylglucosaminyl-diphospho-decaprenol L-rhamnosyltransferase
VTAAGERVPELSVLIVNYMTWTELLVALRSLRTHVPTRPDGTPMPFECIVVDNQSPNRTPAAVAEVEAELRQLGAEQGDPAAGRLILHDENGGYSKGMNLAFAHSRGRWILVSNPDLLFTPGLIAKLQRQLEQDPTAGIVVPKGFWDSDFMGRLPPNTLPTLTDVLWATLGEFSRVLSRWHHRRLLRSWLRAWQAERAVDLPMMSGCLFLIERAFFESIGRFDERYPLYYEDSDLSVAIRRAGRRIVQVPDAQLVHFVNRSGMADPETMWRRHDVSRGLYYAKWYGRLGTAMLRWSKWMLSSPFWRRFRKQPPHAPTTDLGTSAQKPLIVLPRHCERFLLLMSLDARFYLSGGVFGSGDRWTPSDTMFANFGCTVFFYQGYDLTGGRCEPLGTWRYSCRSHLGVPVDPPGGPA